MEKGEEHEFIEEEPDVESDAKAKWLETDDEFVSSMLEKSEEDIDLKLDEATVKAIARRRGFSLIVKFLYENPEPYYTNQIIRATGVGSFHHNIKKLIAVGLVKQVVVPAIDRATKYYTLTSMSAGKRIVDRYLWLVGYKLASALPVNKTIMLTDLKNSAKFSHLLLVYGLKFDEAIECLKKNHKVEHITGKDYYGEHASGFKRIEQ